MHKGPGKTKYAFSVMFRLACYQQAGRVWSGGKGTENTLALAENVYVVLPTPDKHPSFYCYSGISDEEKKFYIVTPGGILTSKGLLASFYLEIMALCNIPFLLFISVSSKLDCL